MKNGCGKSFQNDVISVILSQKGENPSLSSLRMRGMGAQAVLLGIVLCVEDDSTSESREPKNEGKQNAFVLLPSGHGGSRTHLSTATPFSQQSGGIFPESCPLILFRITGRRIKPRADGRPFADAESAVSGSHKPRLPKKKTTSGASWDGRSDRWLRFPRPACPEPSRTDGPEWTFRRRF